jgi:hypothetical protein
MAKKNTNTQKLNPEKLSSEALQPLINWCDEQRMERPSGFVKVADRYNELTGEKKPRCEFQRWLAKEEKDRVQTRFGVGLILLKIADELGLIEKK